ncbi:UNVERIFIED_ORG: hypothetical protein L601_003900000260 [Gordonia westfalica J30]
MAPGEFGETGLEEGVLGLVVGTPRRTGLGPCGFDQFGVDLDPVTVEIHRLRPGRQRLLRPHRPFEDVDHSQAALDAGGDTPVLTAGPNAGEQVADRREKYAGLTERRQDLTDVAEEVVVGSDDENAAARQDLTMCVEQVGGAVQRDGRLAGARPALDDRHTPVRRPDDEVLLPLDGLDDVGHLAGPRSIQRGDEGGFVDDVAVAEVVEEGISCGQRFVADPADLAAAGPDVATTGNLFGRCRGGEVEGTRERCTPVEQQRCVGCGVVVRPVVTEAVVEDTDTADPPDLTVIEVEAAEVQVVFGGVEFREILVVHPLVGLALRECLRGSTVLAQGRGQAALCGLAHPVETAVDAVEVFLFLADPRVGVGGQCGHATTPCASTGRADRDSRASLISPVTRAA